MGAFQEFPQVSSGLFNEQKNCFLLLWFLVKVLLEIVKSCIFQVTFDHLYFCTIQCMKITVNYFFIILLSLFALFCRLKQQDFTLSTLHDQEA